jgi:hypothetical protein
MQGERGPESVSQFSSTSKNVAEVRITPTHVEWAFYLSEDSVLSISKSVFQLIKVHYRNHIHMGAHPLK